MCPCSTVPSIQHCLPSPLGREGLRHEGLGWMSRHRTISLESKRLIKASLIGKYFSSRTRR
eukprot:1160483-Pelagomonas_calceolata.AAC.7